MGGRNGRSGAKGGGSAGRGPAKRAAAAKPANGAANPGAGAAPLHRMTIASDFAAGRDVQTAILDDIERAGFSEEASFAIRLTLEEALINAIKHGNKLDPAKQVHVEYRVDPRTAEITIEDEGPGFDRAAIPDPTAQENLCRLHGRGILLMESYMSQVEWSRHGRRVRMVKHNQ